MLEKSSHFLRLLLKKDEVHLRKVDYSLNALLIRNEVFNTGLGLSPTPDFLAGVCMCELPRARAFNRAGWF